MKIVAVSDLHGNLPELLDTIGRVKPKLVICGHIHGGYGVYNLGDTLVYNVAHVNEAYQPVNPVVEIELGD
jgi:Icc-related predicted phosphoesterase